MAIAALILERFEPTGNSVLWGRAQSLTCGNAEDWTGDELETMGLR
jgi:hypothetical protein